MSDLGKNSGLTSNEISIVVKMSVRDVLEELGMDLSTPEGRASARRDFAYMRAQRVGGEKMAEYVKRSTITVVISGALWAIWYGFRLALGAKGLGP